MPADVYDYLPTVVSRHNKCEEKEQEWEEEDQHQQNQHREEQLWGNKYRKVQHPPSGPAPGSPVPTRRSSTHRVDQHQGPQQEKGKHTERSGTSMHLNAAGSVSVARTGHWWCRVDTHRRRNSACCVNTAPTAAVRVDGSLTRSVVMLVAPSARWLAALTAHGRRAFQVQSAASAIRCPTNIDRHARANRRTRTKRASARSTAQHKRLATSS